MWYSLLDSMKTELTQKAEEYIQAKIDAIIAQKVFDAQKYGTGFKGDHMVAFNKKYGANAKARHAEEVLSKAIREEAEIQ